MMAFMDAMSDLFKTTHTATYDDEGNQVLKETTGIIPQIETGLRNWWYKNTGQAHLTDEYKHEEELANTAYQRAAADMEAAGLSKFGGVSGASSPSPSSGQGLLATALAAENLKGARLSNKENKYNLKIAQKWGVPTSSVDQFAKYDALCKFLFGADVHDFVGEGGLIGILKGIFGKPDSSDNGYTPFSADLSMPGTAANAAVDAVSHVTNDLSNGPLQSIYNEGAPMYGMPDLYKPIPFTITPETYERFHSWKEGVLSGENAPSFKANLTTVINGVNHSSAVKELEDLTVRMFDDNQVTDHNIEMIANSVASRYDLNVGDCVMWIKTWLQENSGDAVKRW